MATKTCFSPVSCRVIHHISLLAPASNEAFIHAAGKFYDRIYSTSPLYVWANQAKISCAKSYGNLRMTRKWRKRPDEVMIQKCDCFYQRMNSYLGR